jgi:hypothetical protein
MLSYLSMQRTAFYSVVTVQGTAVPGTQGEDWPGARTGDGEGEAGAALHSPPSFPGAGQSQIRYYNILSTRLHLSQERANNISGTIISSPPASISPRYGPITDQVPYLLSIRFHLSQERANHRSGTIISSPPASISPMSGPITDQVLFLLSIRFHLSQERANHRSGTISPLHPLPSFPGAGQSQIRYYINSPPASIFPRSGPITDQVLYQLSTRLHLSQERANLKSGTIPPLHPPPSFPGAGQSQIRYYFSSPPASIFPRSGPITDQVLYLLSTRPISPRSWPITDHGYYTSSPPASIFHRSGPITDQVLYLLSTRLHLSQERANHRSGIIISSPPASISPRSGPITDQVL